MRKRDVPLFNFEEVVAHVFVVERDVFVILSDVDEHSPEHLHERVHVVDLQSVNEELDQHLHNHQYTKR